MAEQLSIGLIGTGSISQTAHIPAWNTVEGATVESVAEPNDENRDAALDALTASADVDAYSGYEEMLEAIDLDLVDVTIPPGDVKLEAIRTALDRGVNVTCQKPFAESLSPAADLIDVADRKGVSLSVNQQARHAEAFERGRDYLDAGELGDLRTIQVRSDFWLDGDHQWLDYSVHTYDLVRYWAGAEPRRVMAWFPEQTDDRHVLAAWLDFGGGLVATIWDEFSSNTMLRWNYRLMGDGGTLRGHEAFGDMIPPETVYTPAGELSERSEPVSETYVPDAFANYFDSVVTALREGEEVPTSGADNLHTLRIAFAVRQSFERGEWVDLDDFVTDGA